MPPFTTVLLRWSGDRNVVVAGAGEPVSLMLLKAYPQPMEARVAVMLVAVCTRNYSTTFAFNTRRLWIGSWKNDIKFEVYVHQFIACVTSQCKRSCLLSVTARIGTECICMFYHRSVISEIDSARHPVSWHCQAAVVDNRKQYSVSMDPWLFTEWGDFWKQVTVFMPCW